MATPSSKESGDRIFSFCSLYRELSRGKGMQTAVSSASWAMNAQSIFPAISKISTMRTGNPLTLGIISRRLLYIRVTWKADMSSSALCPLSH